MTPEFIVNTLDNKLPRNENRGCVTWLGRRGQRFTARIDADGDVHSVIYMIRPGVYVERETKFARPYGAPR